MVSLSDLPDTTRDDAPTQLEIRLRRRARINSAIRYGLLILVGLVMIYPLIWLIGASFKTNSEMFSSAWFWPKEPTLDGYVKGWQTSTPYTFATFFINSMQIVIPKVIGTAVSCTLVAYGFARFEFPGKKVLFTILIATLLLPDVVTRIPQYLLFRELGWLDTYLPLFAPSWLAGDAFFVFMVIQFLRAIPREMEEAAFIDKASRFQALWHVILPQARGGIAVTVIFIFLNAWNEFLFAVQLGGNTVRPVTVAMYNFVSVEQTLWAKLSAAALVAMIPMIVIGIAAQRQIVKGLTVGAVKGGGRT